MMNANFYDLRSSTYIIKSFSMAYMNMFNYIEQMTSYIKGKNWDELESYFKEVAESLANKAIADKISSADLSNYQNSICEKLSLAVEKAQILQAKAVYFEYDLDNDWQSHFFICEDYYPPAMANDEWACDWIDELKGEELIAFGDLYVPGFDEPESAKGINLYLIARTISAFGRCSEHSTNHNLAICIAFHDQDPIMRIYEPIA